MIKTVDSRFVAALIVLAGWYAMPAQAADYVVFGAGEHDLDYSTESSVEEAEMAAFEVQTGDDLGGVTPRLPQDCLLAGAGPFDYAYSIKGGIECVAVGAGEHDL